MKNVGRIIAVLWIKLKVTVKIICLHNMWTGEQPVGRVRASSCLSIATWGKQTLSVSWNQKKQPMWLTDRDTSHTADTACNYGRRSTYFTTPNFKLKFFHPKPTMFWPAHFITATTVSLNKFLQTPICIFLQWTRNTWV